MEGHRLKQRPGDLPSDPVIKTLPSSAGMQVQPLVRELEPTYLLAKNKI